MFIIVAFKLVLLKASVKLQALMNKRVVGKKIGFYFKNIIKVLRL